MARFGARFTTHVERHRESACNGLVAGLLLLSACATLPPAPEVEASFSLPAATEGPLARTARAVRSTRGGDDALRLLGIPDTIPRGVGDWSTLLHSLPADMHVGKSVFLQDNPEVLAEHSYRLYHMLEDFSADKTEEIIIVTPYLIPVGISFSNCVRTSIAVPTWIC